MSAKHSRLTLPSSSQKIRKAKARLKQMPKERQIDLMVAAGVMTEKQATRAKKNLSQAKVIK
jgi:NADH:ubiquinone oxidoreductase subunit B-like Fe-S oxidoreductase